MDRSTEFNFGWNAQPSNNNEADYADNNDDFSFDNWLRKDLAAELRNEESMLPAPSSDDRSSRSGSGTPRPPNTQGINFLKVENLNPNRTYIATILDVSTENAGFNDLICKVEIDGTRYFFGMKAHGSNAQIQNYRVLYDGLGADEKLWKGRKFCIGLNWSDYYEKNFIHVFEAPAPEDKQEHNTPSPAPTSTRSRK